MDGAEIINILEKSKDLPIMNNEITEVINMIGKLDYINIEEFSNKLARCGNISEALLSTNISLTG